jgi:hypothetical protein
MVFCAELGETGWREEERQSPLLGNHEPPRVMRLVPVAGPGGFVGGLEA